MLERVRSEHGRELDFPLLSDPDSRVIGRYGLLNPDGRGWPHPTVFVIDRDGVVRWRFMEVDYRVRATNEDILAALAELRLATPTRGRARPPPLRRVGRLIRLPREPFPRRYGWSLVRRPV